MGRSNNGEGKGIQNDSQQKKKKLYLKPHLTDYGCVEKLTQGFGGTKTDVDLGRTRR